MSIQEIQDYCQSLPNTEKAMPCGENLLVFHMEGNIYLYVWLKAPIPSITVSCCLSVVKNCVNDTVQFLQHTTYARNIGMTFLLRGLFLTT